MTTAASICRASHHGIDQVVRCAHRGDDYVAFGKSKTFEAYRTGWYVLTSQSLRWGTVYPVWKDDLAARFELEHVRAFGIAS